MNKPNKIITHHAVSSRTHIAKDVSRWHFERWKGYARSVRSEAPYAGYTYIIEWDGTIVQCRNHDEEGIHCRGQNFSSIGVCFMGNNDVHYPSEAQKGAWWRLYQKLEDEYGSLPVHPHRLYANKSCHGKLLSDTYWADLVEKEESTLESLKLKVLQLRVKLLTMLLKERMRG